MSVNRFGCRVGSDGKKTWNAIARRRKERKRFTFGDYPAVKLVDARAQARRALDRFRDGLEDASAGAPGDSPAEAGLLFGTLAERYLNEYSKIHKSSWRQDVERYGRALEPHWRETPVSTLDTEAVLTLLRPRRDQPTEHDHVKCLISAIFKWGIQEQIVFKNPAAGIPQAMTSKVRKARAVRQRAYSEDEIRRIWKALDQLPFAEGAFFKFGFYTAQRLGTNLRSPEDSMGDKAVHGTDAKNTLTPEQQLKRAKVNPQSDDRGEILFMEWREIDWDTGWWTCPGARTKNGLANRVPLAPEAIQLLQAVLADQKARSLDTKYVWVFNEARRFPTYLRRIAEAHGIQIDRRPPVYLRKQALQIRKLSGVADFSQHCVRHTVTTHMTASGVDELDVAKLLSHVSNNPNRNVTGVYNHYRYDTEKRDIIDFWMVKLRMILQGGATAALHFKTFSMQRWIERQKAEEGRVAAPSSHGSPTRSTP